MSTPNYNDPRAGSNAFSIGQQEILRLKNRIKFIEEAFDKLDDDPTDAIPTKLSELQNDVGFITENDIPDVAPAVFPDIILSENFSTKIGSSIHDIEPNVLYRIQLTSSASGMPDDFSYDGNTYYLIKREYTLGSGSTARTDGTYYIYNVKMLPIYYKQYEGSTVYSWHAIEYSSGSTVVVASAASFTETYTIFDRTINLTKSQFGLTDSVTIDHVYVQLYTSGIVASLTPSITDTGVTITVNNILAGNGTDGELHVTVVYH